MSVVEVDLPAGAEADQFSAALYRFLELHSPSLAEDDTVVIESFPFGLLERKRVKLWSPTAAADFVRFWRKCASTERRGWAAGVSAL